VLVGVEAVVEIVSVEVPVFTLFFSVMLDGLNAVVGPLATDGRTEDDRATVPVKPVLVRVIVEVVEPPATKLAWFGEADMIKSGCT